MEKNLEWGLQLVVHFCESFVDIVFGSQGLIQAETAVS